MNNVGQMYQSADFIMIRTPLLTINKLERLFTTNFLSSNLLSSGEGLPTQEINNALTEDKIVVRKWLTSVLDDPIIREAIYIGSPSLYKAIRRWKEDPDSKKGRQAEIGLLRYISRMSTRPTPYGLYAGINIGTVDKQTKIFVDAEDTNLKKARLDYALLVRIAQAIYEDPHLRGHFQVFPNSLLYRIGERLIIPHLEAYEQETSDNTVSIKASPVILRIISLAKKGIYIDELIETISSEWPDVPKDKIESYIFELYLLKIIICPIFPPTTIENPTDYILNCLSLCKNFSNTLETISKLRFLISQYCDLFLGEGEGVLQEIYSLGGSLIASPNSVLQVDMFTTLNQKSISAEIATEVGKACEIALSISTYGPYFPHLQNYKKEFLEKYGVCREVPLLQMLDDDLGLGAPQSYMHPSPHKNFAPLVPTPNPRRETILYNLAATSLLHPNGEILLTEDMLAQLQVFNNWHEFLPNSLDIYIEIVAKSQDEVNEGKYEIIVGPRGGSYPCGRTFGRFFYSFSDEIQNKIRNISLDEEKEYPESIYAELVFLPSKGHYGNVVIRPLIREYEVLVTGSPSVSADKVIALDDLVVGLKGNRFYLKSISLDKEIIIRCNHLLNPITAPNIYRFLAEVGAEGSIEIGKFDWGNVAKLPYLPRLKYKNIVLSFQSWRLHPYLINSQYLSNEVEWLLFVSDWRKKWKVPRYVFLTEGDNRLLLDLENPICLSDLRAECMKIHDLQTVIVLEEFYPGFDEIWVSGKNGKYIQEYVFPIVKVDLPPRRQEKLPPYKVFDNRIVFPGEEWLYLKLYCGISEQDDLLTGPILGLINELEANSVINRWFYVRYEDPDPHLRLRFKGDKEKLTSELLEKFFALSRQLRKGNEIPRIAIDTYDREIERYGGELGILIAEDLFYYDSSLCANLIKLRNQKTIDLSLIDMGILTVDYLIKTLGYELQERISLYSQLLKSYSEFIDRSKKRLSKFYSSYRKQAQQIIGDPNYSNRVVGGEQMYSLLNENEHMFLYLGGKFRLLCKNKDFYYSIENILGSFIHMHCNRLLGINRPLEAEIIYYLTHTYRGFEKFIPQGYVDRIK